MKNVDNSFEEVLFRRMFFDLRMCQGWGHEELKRNFMAIVKQTMKEHGIKTKEEKEEA